MAIKFNSKTNLSLHKCLLLIHHHIDCFSYYSHTDFFFHTVFFFIVGALFILQVEDSSEMGDFLGEMWNQELSPRNNVSTSGRHRALPAKVFHSSV